MLRDIIQEMKDTSELMIDLAFAALLFRDTEIAEDVQELEEQMDTLNYQAKMTVLELAQEVSREGLLSVLELINATENIADAAGEIASNVFRGEIHPIFKEAMQETEEVVTRFQISEESVLADQTLGELKLATKTGMHVFLVKRSKKYIINPEKNFRLQKGDIIFAEGPPEGKDQLEDLL
ncbi:MAG: potassium channel protein [Theionarchaea archaeon]|nr:MAG: hypothetical protein AYK18_05555 [Theionarchaea archaeon DG-70]MBU7012099.1 potassium channel protein [Theionarchaea archaeon]